MRRRRGFGLIETMLALSLFTVVLVVLAQLMNGYREMVRHSQGRDRSLKAASVALSRLRADLRAAARVVSPTSGEASVLELERLPSTLSPRLPATLPSTPPTSWNIMDPAQLYAIDYRLQDDTLIRQVDGSDIALAEGLTDFQVKVLSTDRYQLTLTVRERGRELALIGRVSRP